MIRSRYALNLNKKFRNLSLKLKIHKRNKHQFLTKFTSEIIFSKASKLTQNLFHKDLESKNLLTLNTICSLKKKQKDQKGLSQKQLKN